MRGDRAKRDGSVGLRKISRYAAGLRSVERLRYVSRVRSHLAPLDPLIRPRFARPPSPARGEGALPIPQLLQRQRGLVFDLLESEARPDIGDAAGLRQLADDDMLQGDDIGHDDP